MSKRYEIKTIEDIKNLPEGSFDNFLVDLKAWHSLVNSFPKLIEEVAATAGIKTRVESTDVLTWIDNGGHDATINLEVKK